MLDFWFGALDLNFGSLILEFGCLIVAPPPRSPTRLGLWAKGAAEHLAFGFWDLGFVVWDC